MPNAHGNGVFTELLIKRLIRLKLIAPGLSAGTLCKITGIKANVALPMMIHQTCQEMLAALIRTAEIPTPRNNAMP